MNITSIMYKEETLKRKISNFQLELSKVYIRKSYKKCMAFTFTFSHLADAFIQSDLQLGST